MGSKWFTSAETDQVEIDIGGEAVTLWLKQELSWGEQRAVDTSGFDAVSGFGGDGKRRARRQAADAPENMRIDVNWKKQSTARIMAYVADWSLTDEKNNKLPIATATLEEMRQDVVTAIEDAITAHVERREAMRKNDQSTTSSSGTSRRSKSA